MPGNLPPSPFLGPTHQDGTAEAPDPAPRPPPHPQTPCADAPHTRHGFGYPARCAQSDGCLYRPHQPGPTRRCEKVAQSLPLDGNRSPTHRHNHASCLLAHKQIRSYHKDQLLSIHHFLHTGLSRRRNCAFELHPQTRRHRSSHRVCPHLRAMGPAKKSLAQIHNLFSDHAASFVVRLMQTPCNTTTTTTMDGAKAVHLLLQQPWRCLPQNLSRPTGGLHVTSADTLSPLRLDAGHVRRRP